VQGLPSTINTLATVNPNTSPVKTLINGALLPSYGEGGLVSVHDLYALTTYRSPANLLTRIDTVRYEEVSSARSLNTELLTYLKEVEQLRFSTERGDRGIKNHSLDDEAADRLGLLLDFNLVSGSDIEF
jgi:hypothetical protein